MIKFIKDIWAAPWTVKLSIGFLLLVLIVALIGNPGRVIFTLLLLGAVFTLIDWIFDKK